MQSKEVRTGAAASASATNAALRALVALLCITMKNDEHSHGSTPLADETAGHALRMLQDVQMDAAASSSEKSRQQGEGSTQSKHRHAIHGRSTKQRLKHNNLDQPAATSEDLA